MKNLILLFVMLVSIGVHSQSLDITKNNFTALENYHKDGDTLLTKTEIDALIIGSSDTSLWQLGSGTGDLTSKASTYQFNTGGTYGIFGGTKLDFITNGNYNLFIGDSLRYLHNNYMVTIGNKFDNSQGSFGFRAVNGGSNNYNDYCLTIGSNLNSIQSGADYSIIVGDDITANNPYGFSIGYDNDIVAPFNFLFGNELELINSTDSFNILMGDSLRFTGNYNLIIGNNGNVVPPTLQNSIYNGDGLTATLGIVKNSLILGNDCKTKNSATIAHILGLGDRNSYLHTQSSIIGLNGFTTLRDSVLYIPNLYAKYDADIQGNIGLSATTSSVGTITWNGLYGLNTFGGNLIWGGGNLTMSGVDNTGVGVNSLSLLTTGFGMTVFGKDAGKRANTAKRCTYAGVRAGESNTSATDQTFTGYRTGRLCISASNTFYGAYSGEFLYTGNGNTGSGYSSLSGSTGAKSSVKYNTGNGYRSGANIASSVEYGIYLGAYAGNYVTKSNMLYIDSYDWGATPDSSFITGDMQEDSLIFNASVRVTGGFRTSSVVSGANYYLENEDFTVVMTNATDTAFLNSAPITDGNVEVINASSGNILINGNGKTIGNVSPTNDYILPSGSVLCIKFINSNWYLNR